MSKRRKLPDTYEKWKQQGLLDKKLEGVRDLISRKASERQVAEYLGISQKTLIKLKNKHPKLAEAIDKGNEEMRKTLLSNIYKIANGYHYEKVVTAIQETSSGPRKKVVKETLYEGPKLASNRYLLITQFGDEYNEKKREIDLMEKRLENNDESWSSGDEDED